MKSMVCGFMFDELGQVLLLKKVKPAWQAGRLNGVGGKIEEGETPVQAMVREFEEETTIKTQPDDWKIKVHLKGPDYEVFFFAANVFRIKGVGQPTPEIPVLVAAKHPPIYGINGEGTILYNLRWLLPLCGDLDLDFPIVVHDKVKEPGSGTNPGMTTRTARAEAC